MTVRLLCVVQHFNGLFTVMIVAVTGCCGRQCGDVPANKHNPHSFNWIQSLEYESMSHDVTEAVKAHHSDCSKTLSV